MLQKHIVKLGESVARIASKYGFPKWETVYQHPLNKPFRQLRPQAARIQPGDELIIPDKTPQDGTRSFEEYMVRVMALEEAAIQQNYSFLDRITALRLIRYRNNPVREYGGTTLGGGPWPLIIPGAASVTMPSSWSQSPLKEMVEYVRNAKVVKIGSVSVDLGHAFAGLDARLRPSRVRVTVAGIPALEMRSNHEAASYVGDLGSVVAHYAPMVVKLLWQKLDKPNSTFLKIYNDWAGEEDSLGDVDSYSIQLNPQRTVTQNLLDYYLAQTGGVRQRCRSFLAQVKLTQPATRQALEKEVFVAAQFVLAGDKNIAELMQLYKQPEASLERPKAMIYSEVIKLTLDTFTSWCQKMAKAE